MLDTFEFQGEGVYYIICFDFPNYCLSIDNINTNFNSGLNISLFQDSVYQAFYFFENEDNSYYIMNIMSLKILGVNNRFHSIITQKDIEPLEKYKWNITKNDYLNNYYIESPYYNERLDFNNENVIINEKNNFCYTQRFIFKKCTYNIAKSDIWQKWEIHLFREFIDDQLYIISSAENENNVITLNSYNNITITNFTGNKEQIFFILKKDNNYFFFSHDQRLIGVNYSFYSIVLNANNNLVKYQINKTYPQYNDYPLYNISFQDNYYNYYNLDITTNYYNSFLEFKQPNYYSPSQFFVFRRVTCIVFRKYLLNFFLNYNSGKFISFKLEKILDYALDAFRNLTYIIIDKDTKYISDNVFKNNKTIQRIKINYEWLNKFNKNNIMSIEFNDNISVINLKSLREFINLKEIHLPLSIETIKGADLKYIPKVNMLECDPKLLADFNEINLEYYIVNREIKVLKRNNINPFLTAKINCLILTKELSKIEFGFFNNSYFNIIKCEMEHIKYLNKNGVSNIFLGDKNTEIICSNTFEDFRDLETVILPTNLKKIESKAFNNCKKLEYLKIPDSCTDIRWDSFYNCSNFEIDCNDSIKEKLKRNVLINENNNHNLNNYLYAKEIEINPNIYISRNDFKKLSNITSLKCDSDILYKLPLNKNWETNIKILIIQNGANLLKKDMFKYSANLEFISIPLSIKHIEEGTFDECHRIRTVQCDPIFLNLFNKHYVTSFLIQDGVKNLFKKDFENMKYIQYLYIPKTVKSIEEGSFLHFKKLMLLKCEEKWENDKYFPFTCIIEEGTEFIDRDIFREWYNLKYLSIPNSVKTVLPYTFADCQDIKGLKCSPSFFNLLNIGKVKTLILPEGVKYLNKGDLKGFNNLIYLKLPNTIKNIDKDVFNDTPCLNYDNISDHPIIRRIKKETFKESNNIKDTDEILEKILKFMRDRPSIDKPDYNFENNNDIKDEYKEDEDEDIIESKIEKKQKNEVKKKKTITLKNNYFDNMKYEKNNKITNKMKKNKTERTVEDIVKYDKTNAKYAPFISNILNCIKVGRNKMQNGSGLQELSFKLSEICIKINKKYKFIPRPVQILAILRLADSVFNNNYKGSIGEIKTGEGKSFIVSTLAILLCLYGKK